MNLPVYYNSRVFKVVDLKCGREGSLAVAEDARTNRDMIFDNQYTLGGSASTPSLRRQAHLPLLFHPAPAKVAFIGFGTGITASGALEHEAVKSTTAVELCAMVAEAAERDFGQFNHDICHASRAKVYVEDAADSRADWSLWTTSRSPWAFLRVAHPPGLAPRADSK